MPTRCAYSYAVVRVVPHVAREEFVNAGIVLFAEARDYLAARIDLDEARLRAIAPSVDVALVRRHLEAMERICEGGEDAGPIGKLALRERWRWIVAPRSTMIQTSAPHGGMCTEPNAEMDRLVRALVRTPT